MRPQVQPLTAQSFFSLISDVADKEMQTVGQDTDRSIPATAIYIESVKRIQIWTLELLAAMSLDNVTNKMFEELAEGIEQVPDIDLWMGEPGASGL